jgi:hypothetical protein
MSDDVVTIMRNGVIEHCSAWIEPQELAFVLDRLADVPFEGDIYIYVALAKEVLQGALEAALAPRIARLQAETASHRARIAQLEADYARSVEALANMQVNPTIH